MKAQKSTSYLKRASIFIEIRTPTNSLASHRIGFFILIIIFPAVQFSACWRVAKNFSFFHIPTGATQVAETILALTHI